MAKKPNRLQNPDRVKQFREIYDLSQRELGLLLGLTAACISQWESGARLIPMASARLLRALRDSSTLRKSVFKAEGLQHKLTDV